MRKLIESVSGAVQIAARILLYPLLRRRRRRWGTSEEEMALRLPGDELAAEPRWTHTTRSRSMPAVGRLAWLVQLGQGGFYTYEGLENLVGCQFRNVMGIDRSSSSSPPATRSSSMGAPGSARRSLA